MVESGWLIAAFSLPETLLTTLAICPAVAIYYQLSTIN
jgi:hypothetical protein